MKKALCIFFMLLLTLCACSCTQGASSVTKKLNGSFEAEIQIKQGERDVRATLYMGAYKKGEARDVRICLQAPSGMTLEAKAGKVFICENGFSLEFRNVPPLISELAAAFSVDSISSLPKENGKLVFLSDGNTRIYSGKNGAPLRLIFADTSVEILSFEQSA